MGPHLLYWQVSPFSSLSVLPMPPSKYEKHSQSEQALRRALHNADSHYTQITMSIMEDLQKAHSVAFDIASIDLTLLTNFYFNFLSLNVHE